MLVENKFIFLSLPRCASTAFHIACLKHNFVLDFVNENIIKFNKININKSNEEIADKLLHIHEPILFLKEKFGNELPIISVKRNVYDTFISLYKHIIDEFNRIDESDIVETLKNADVDDILFFNTEDIMNYEESVKTVINLIERLELKLKHNENQEYTFIMLHTLVRHPSVFHDNDPNIIWFDIDKLNELENWVSNITGKKFNIEKINSSANFECKIKLNDEFKKKYDEIYGVLNERKTKIIKSII